jgi:putative ABC transport system permease protein
MGLGENIRIALRALAANKLRSALTMLGIIIGVGAVVALMAIGNGATASITSQVQGIGSNLITVFPGRFERGGQPTVAYLYLTDYEALRRGLRDVVAIAPSFQGAGQSVVYGKTSLNLSLTATTPEFASVRAYTVQYGRFLTDQDRATSARVVVLGSQTATDLFGGLNPVGRSLKVGGVAFEVVGLLASKGATGFDNSDEIVIIPLETGYNKVFGAQAIVNGRRRLSDISVSAANPDVVGSVMVQMERILRREHGLKLTEDLDVTVLSQSAFLSALTAITATLTVFLGAIAGISLLVGGIGIMNIMLVSVTERTKEIGLRKAVGARRRVIMLQFLIETMVLALFGGLMGIGMGWGIAAGVTAAELIEARVTLDAVMLAFFFSAAVGLFFGLYPAWRASRLSPIEALRYE